MFPWLVWPDGGVHTTALIVGDHSNDTDGIV